MFARRFCDRQTIVGIRWHFPIFIMDDLSVGKYYSVSRLTIEPGNTIKMAAAKRFRSDFILGVNMEESYMQ